MSITIQDDGRGNTLQRTKIPHGWSAGLVPGSTPSCAWCGSAARFIYTVHRNGRPALLGAPLGQGSYFCSIGCFRTYSS